jgi:uncharacterized SAM-binding protein YcdF (DUF218 family)
MKSLYTAQIKRQQRARRLRKALKAALVLLVAWLTGFAWFVGFMPSAPALESVDHGDGIVVLTGGAGRIAAGLEALAAGRGKRLLISGVNGELARSTILNAIGGDRQLTECCIDLGREASDTRGNALEALNWAREHDYASLVVITANYHMRRSLIEIEVLDRDVTIYPYAIETDGGWGRLALEYSKYLISLARKSLGF